MKTPLFVEVELDGEDDELCFVTKNKKRGMWINISKAARLASAMANLAEELGNIANAKRGNFENSDEFRDWAQNRARFALRKLKEAEEA